MLCSGSEAFTGSVSVGFSNFQSKVNKKQGRKFLIQKSHACIWLETNKWKSSGIIWFLSSKRCGLQQKSGCTTIYTNHTMMELLERLLSKYNNYSNRNTTKKLPFWVVAVCVHMSVWFQLLLFLETLQEECYTAMILLLLLYFTCFQELFQDTY